MDKETLQKVLAAIGFDFDKVKDSPQRDQVASTIMDALYKQVMCLGRQVMALG